jgi:hypothetical protein
MTDQTLIKLPLTFFQDHEERDLETPAVVKATKTHIFVDARDPALDELLSDAMHYADSVAWMGREYFGLCMSAKATERAIRKARAA